MFEGESTKREDEDEDRCAEDDGSLYRRLGRARGTVARLGAASPSIELDCPIVILNIQRRGEIGAGGTAPSHRALPGKMGGPGATPAAFYSGRLGQVFE